tara:strand:+ start:784 stop:2217 length:1434 start_codon:yes stop_codon:yes gene_type:complete
MNFKYKTKPYKHQEEALEKSYNKNYYAYFMEMGCGKSKVLIDNIAWLYLNKKIDTAVIVAPKGVYRNWKENEIPIHLHDDINCDVYLWTPQPNKMQKKELVDGAHSRNNLRILLVNVEGFATTKMKNYIEFFTKDSNFLLAIDESTTIKNPRAKRTKALVSFGKLAKYKRILTGSPVTNSPLDLYSQCSFMHTDLLGHDSFWSFQGKYAITRTQRMGNHSFQQIVGYKNLDDLSERLHTFSYRVTKEDALDLPEKIYTTREVLMTSEQLKHYKSIKDAAIALLDDGQLVSAPAVMTQLLRLQQILCGHTLTDDGELVEFKSNRIDAMIETIEEMDGSVIIWSRFRYDIKNIKKALEKTYGNGTVVTFYGDTSEKDRQIAEQSLNNGSARFFVANPQTAGRGLTLNKASNVIYYANDFNLESRIQSEARCHRIGQKKTVLYVDLVAKGTVDEHIVKTLKSKNELSARSLGEQVREWLK